MVSAHCPSFGLKRYRPEVVLFTIAGLQVPLIPLREVSGSKGAREPAQIGSILANVAEIEGVTVTITVSEVAEHEPLPTVTK